MKNYYLSKIMNFVFKYYKKFFYQKTPILMIFFTLKIIYLIGIKHMAQMVFFKFNSSLKKKIFKNYLMIFHYILKRK